MNPDAWLDTLQGQAFARRVEASGCVTVDHEPYYIRQALAGQQVVLFVNEARAGFRRVAGVGRGQRHPDQRTALSRDAAGAVPSPDARASPFPGATAATGAPEAAATEVVGLKRPRRPPPPTHRPPTRAGAVPCCLELPKMSPARLQHAPHPPQTATAPAFLSRCSPGGCHAGWVVFFGAGVPTRCGVNRTVTMTENHTVRTHSR